MKPAPDRVQAADHAGAAAERDDRDPPLGAEREQGGDLLLAAGQHHGVRRVLLGPAAAAQQVRRGLAAGAQQPVGVGGADVLGADDRGQVIAVGRGEGGGRQDDLGGGEFGLLGGGDAERRGEQVPDVRRQGLGQGGIAPAVPPHRGKREGRLVGPYLGSHRVTSLHRENLGGNLVETCVTV